MLFIAQQPNAFYSTNAQVNVFKEIDAKLSPKNLKKKDEVLNQILVGELVETAHAPLNKEEILSSYGYRDYDAEFFKMFPELAPDLSKQGNSKEKKSTQRQLLESTLAHPDQLLASDQTSDDILVKNFIEDLHSRQMKFGKVSVKVQCV